MGKAVISGNQLPKAAENETAVGQKTPAEFSSPDSKSEQTPETCNKESEVVGKDAGLVSRSKDGTVVKAKPVLKAKVPTTQTPSDPSGSLDATRSAFSESSASTASDNRPQTGDGEQKGLKMESEVDTFKTDSTGKKTSPSSKKLTTSTEKVEDEASMGASEPVHVGKSEIEAVKSDESGSAAVEEGNVTTEAAASEKTEDKPIELQPAAGTAATPSTKTGLINAPGMETIIVKAETI